MPAHTLFSKNTEVLFEKVVEKIGLSMIIGPGIVRRALAAVGADAKFATPINYVHCLGALEQRLAAYMDPATVSARVNEVRTLLQAWP